MADGAHYAAQSHVTPARKLVGKRFLIVGEIGRDVDPDSIYKVVDALIKADKDPFLLVVSGAGDDGRRRQADFFVRHLLGVKPRARQS